MKILNLHCTEFDYEAIKETPVAEHDGTMKAGYDNVLVCFTCYEKRDENRHDEILKAFVENTKIDVGRIKPEIVLIYPYAHLSKSLGSAKLAKQVLQEMEEALKNEGIIVARSPFGWYKKFNLSCKGHPLAEGYREY